MKKTSSDVSRLGEDWVGRRAELAARLLGAARATKPTVRVTLSEIQAAIRARRYTAMHSIARLAAVFVLVLCPMVALASIAVSRGWWGSRARPAATSISVPAGATTRIGRRGRFDVSLTGPTTVEIAGDDGPIGLAAGELVLSNEAAAAGREPRRSVEILVAHGHRVEIAPSATVAIRTTDAGGVQVASLSGPAPRVDGVPQREPPPATAAPRALTSAAAPSASAPPSANRPLPTPKPNVTAPRPSPAADEVGIVHDALERLRGERDATAALRLLDEHDRRFPDGMLRDEADITRVEALLALRRTAEALDRLEAMAPAPLDRSPRLRVARGELRAAQGHCQEALADFTAASAAGAGGEIERRIERGRAACNASAPRHTGERGGNQ